ncbi:MAG: hypothetical protein L6W00_07215 [Lentisphaeria bacterium]|nr:MAG: hypothetical protein L6W00_07215 [Lentisphaeria bacterium]
MFDFTAYPVDEVRRRFFVRPRPAERRGDSLRSVLFDRSITDRFRMEKFDIRGKAAFSGEGLRLLIVTAGGGTPAPAEPNLRSAASTGCWFRPELRSWSLKALAAWSSFRPRRPRHEPGNARMVSCFRHTPSNLRRRRSAPGVTLQ